MIELSITTPALLFSAVSLILLAYTNRFLAYAQIVRSLYSEFKKDKNYILIGQIKNLRKRLILIKWMQILGVVSLFLSVFSMLFLYLHWNMLGAYAFAFGLLSMIGSLAVSVWEINISVVALNIHLKGMEEHE